MNIKVDGMQYAWQFTYPSIDDKTVFAYTDMYVPVGMTVTLDIGSNDVQHSWWIPELGGKMDALPGYTNKTWFKVDRAGHVPGPVRRAVRAQPREHVRARRSRCRSTSGRPGTTGRPRTSQAAKDAAAAGREELEQQEGEDAVRRGRRHRHHLRGRTRVGTTTRWPHSTTPPARRPARRSSPTACGPSPRAGRRGSRRPTTSGSGSSTSGRSPRSSCSAASRRC